MLISLGLLYSITMYVCITIIANVWSYHWSFKFNLITDIICSLWFITYFTPIFCSPSSGDSCNFISNQIASCFSCFLNCSFWSSFKCICSRLFSMIKTFLTVFTAYVLPYNLTNNFSHISCKRQKSIAFYKYSISSLNWISCHILYVIG